MTFLRRQFIALGDRDEDPGTDTRAAEAEAQTATTPMDAANDQRTVHTPLAADVPDRSPATAVEGARSAVSGGARPLVSAADGQVGQKTGRQGPGEDVAVRPAGGRGRAVSHNHGACAGCKRHKGEASKKREREKEIDGYRERTIARMALAAAGGVSGNGSGVSWGAAAGWTPAGVGGEAAAAAARSVWGGWPGLMGSCHAGAAIGSDHGNNDAARHTPHQVGAPTAGAAMVSATMAGGAGGEGVTRPVGAAACSGNGGCSVTHHTTGA